MAYKGWKHAERRTAKVLGGQRTPLSGGASLHTRGDVIHPQLFVEVKQRKRFAVLSVMKLVEDLAKLEGKLPVLVLHEAGAHRQYYVLSEPTLLKLVQLLSNGGTNDPRVGTPDVTGGNSSVRTRKSAQKAVSGAARLESKPGTDDASQPTETVNPKLRIRKMLSNRRRGT